MPDRNPTLPLFQSLRLRKTVAFFLCPFCIVMPTHGKREVGGNFAGREGGIESVKWWWWKVMMKWLTFYILYTMAFWELEGNTKLLFVFYFCFLDFAFAPCILCFETGEPWKPCANSLRSNGNVCGLWKMFAPNLCAWRKKVCALWKMFALAEKCLRPLNKKNGAKKGKSEIKKTRERTTEQLQLPEERTMNEN